MIIIITTTFTLIIHMVEDGSSRVLDCGARCVVVLLAHVSDDAVPSKKFNRDGRQCKPWDCTFNESASTLQLCILSLRTPKGLRRRGGLDMVSTLKLKILPRRTSRVRGYDTDDPYDMDGGPLASNLCKSKHGSRQRMRGKRGRLRGGPLR